MATKHDYQTLEREYIEGDMSIRQLCRDHDISAWSTVNAYAKKHAWEEKREHYRKQLTERQNTAVAERLAEQRADLIANTLDDAIKVSNKAIFAFFDSLEDRWVQDPENPDRRILIPAQQITAADFVKIMDKILVLNGQPTKREAHLGLNVDINGDGPLNLEALRDIASFARQRGANPSATSGTSPIPRSERARPVN